MFFWALVKLQTLLARRLNWSNTSLLNMQGGMRCAECSETSKLLQAAANQEVTVITVT